MNREQKIEIIATIIREGANYQWKSNSERLAWRKIANRVIENHISGNKTIISEACVRAHLTDTDRILIESGGQLSEGFWSNLRDTVVDKVGGGLASLAGRIPGIRSAKSRNWWIFGGGGEKETAKYRKAREKAIAASDKFMKVAQKSISSIEEEIEKEMPDFPNGGPADQFQTAMAKFGEIYLTIKAAAVSGGCTIEDANELIENLRATLNSYDRDLQDIYTYSMEMPKDRKKTAKEDALSTNISGGTKEKVNSESFSRITHMTLLEQRDQAIAFQKMLRDSMLQNNPYSLRAALLGEAPEKEDKDNLGRQGVETSGMKGLKSNVAPAIIAALGIIGGAAAAMYWIAPMQQWVMIPGAMKYITKASLVGVAKKGITLPFAVALGKKPGTLGGMSVDDFKSLMVDKGYIDGDWNATDNLLQVAVDKEGMQYDFLAALRDADPSSKLNSIIPADGLGRAGGPGDVWTEQVWKSVQEAVKDPDKWVKAGTDPQLALKLGAGAVAAAPFLLGAGGIKLLRMYGQKKSRTALVQAYIDDMKDVTEDDVKAASTEAAGKNVGLDGAGGAGGKGGKGGDGGGGGGGKLDLTVVSLKPGEEDVNLMTGKTSGDGGSDKNPGEETGEKTGKKTGKKTGEKPAGKTFGKVTGKDAMLAAYAYGLTRKRIEKKYNSVKNDLERQAANQGLKAGAKEKFVKEKLRDQNVVTPGSPEHKKLWQKELQRVFSTKDISISESLSLRGAFSHLFEFRGVTGTSSKFMSSLGVTDDTSTSKSDLDPKIFAGFEESMAARKEKEKSEQTSAEKAEKPSTPDAAAKPEASSGGPPSDGASGSGSGGGGQETSGPRTRAPKSAAHVYDKISADGRKFIVGSLFEIKKKSRAGAMSLASFLFEAPEAPEGAQIDFEKLWTLVNTQENQINKTPDQLIQKAQASYTSKGDVIKGKASDGLDVRASDEPEGKQQQLLKKYEDISREIDKILNARKMFVNNGVEIKWSDIPKKDASALETQLKTYRDACNAYIDGSGNPKLISQIDPNAIKTLSQGWKFTPPPPETPNEVQATKESFARQDRQLVERWQRLAGIKVI